MKCLLVVDALAGDRCRLDARSGEAGEERELGLVAGQECFVANPDLFDDPAPDFEDRCRCAVRGEIPVVQADVERAGQLQRLPALTIVAPTRTPSSA